MNYNHAYDDIINLKHHVSIKHPPMSLYARSAQFAPFAALTGYEDAVRETARLTQDKIELDEEQKAILDRKLQIIRENLVKKHEVSFTYFVPDLTKSGGKYITQIGIVKRFDDLAQTIILMDKKEIPINELIDISMHGDNFYDLNLF